MAYESFKGDLLRFGREGSIAGTNGWQNLLRDWSPTPTPYIHTSTCYMVHTEPARSRTWWDPSLPITRRIQIQRMYLFCGQRRERSPGMAGGSLCYSLWADYHIVCSLMRELHITFLLGKKEPSSSIMNTAVTHTSWTEYRHTDNCRFELVLYCDP